MRVERTLLENLAETVFNIGYEGEKNHVQVVISCPVMFRDHPDAVASMVVRPPQGDLYPVSLTRSGNDLIWDVSEGDVANSGSGTLQLTFTDGEGDDAEVIKTVFGAYSVNGSLMATGEAPDPVQSWLDEAGAALATFETEVGEIRKITTATTEDEGKALSPKTVVNGKVTEWEYIDTADPEAVQEAVDNWLDDHPEATTTVEDGAITEVKLNSTLKDDLAWKDDVDGLMSAITQEKAPVILDNATGEIVTIPDGADGLDVKTLTVAIEPVQSGSGDPSPENIRPISGWSAAEVTRTGFNQWDEQWEVGGIDSETGDNYTKTDRIRSKNFIPAIAGAIYKFTVGDGSTAGMWVYYYDGNKNFISPRKVANNTSPSTTIKTAPENTCYIRFEVFSEYGTTYNHDICINISNAAKNGQYAPGHVQTKTYNFPTPPGTVYGGTLTVNADGTGKLVVDRAIKDLSSITWSNIDGRGRRYQIFSDILPQTVLSVAPAKFNAENYKTVANNDLYNDTSLIGITLNDNYVYVRTGDENTPTGNLVYPLATPITYNLTDLEVIELLKGTNNLWADCGDTSIEYPCDTKLYVDKKIMQAIANALNA